jgi:hypothetical protein
MSGRKPGPNDVSVSPRGTPTLDRAIEVARSRGGAVHLAAGEYVAHVHATVALFGGWSEDFSERDPERFITRIIAAGDDHSTVAVTVDSDGVTLDGLHLRGGKSKFATALQAKDGARAFVERCVLEGGGRGPSPDGFTYSFAVNVPFMQRPAIVLRRCRLHGGDNQYAWGIDGASDGLVVEDCEIVGGACATPHSSTMGVRGSGAVVLVRSAIDAGHGADATCVSLAGAGATLDSNRMTTRRGDGWNALRLPGCAAVLRGNTLDGVLDDVFYGFAAKLSERTWKYNSSTPDDSNGLWSFDAVTLVPRGLLYYWGDSAIEPTGAGYGGPVQTFADFLERGPASPLPDDVASAIRNAIREAGVGDDADPSMR